jgi:hypothetical protein
LTYRYHFNDNHGGSWVMDEPRLKEIHMMRKVSAVLLMGALLLLSAACGGAATQGELPTLAANPTLEASLEVATEVPIILTFDPDQGLSGTATMDIAGIASTSEAISAPLQQALAQVAGIQNLISVSALATETGIAVNVEAEIAEADNNETTMARILEAVQSQAATVTVINVRTWIGEVLQKTWVWQNGVWSSL